MGVQAAMLLFLLRLDPRVPAEFNNRMEAIRTRFPGEDWDGEGTVARCVVEKVMRMHDEDCLTHLPLKDCISQEQQGRGEKSDPFGGKTCDRRRWPG